MIMAQQIDKEPALFYDSSEVAKNKRALDERGSRVC
jgi:hypothetical protein